MRTTSSQKLILLKLCLLLAIGEDQEDQPRPVVSLVASSETLKASGLKVRIFYNLMTCIWWLTSLRTLCLQEQYGKKTFCNILPRTVLTTPRLRGERMVVESGVVGSQRWWSAQPSPLVTSLHFSENVRFSVLYFLLIFLSLYFSLFSTVPRLSVLSLSILLSVLLFFLFSSLCYCVLFLLYISVSSHSFPPSSRCS